MKGQNDTMDFGGELLIVLFRLARHSANKMQFLENRNRTIFQ